VKTKVILLIIGLVVAGCGGGGSSSGAGATLDKILVIGDSIGNGAGIATPYPERIRSSTGVPVINDSASGRLTDEGLAVAEGLLAQHQPSHLVVLLGTNDARREISSTLSNLQMIVSLGNAADARVVIGTLPPITNSSVDNARAAIVSDGIRGLGGASIAEVRDAMGDGSTTIADGIHPNDLGQDIIAREFLNHL
jgi:acyl-CoA thioesterase-1